MHKYKSKKGMMLFKPKFFDTTRTARGSVKQENENLENKQKEMEQHQERQEFNCISLQYCLHTESSKDNLLGIYSFVHVLSLLVYFKMLAGQDQNYMLRIKGEKLRFCLNRRPKET